MSSPIFRALATAVAALLPVWAGAQAETGRLGRDVVPTNESVRLVVDPARSDYTGSVHVDRR